MNNPNECKVCNTYDLFKTYVKDGIPVEEAFYHSVAQLYEETLADTIDALHESVYKEGVLAGIRSLAEYADDVADNIEFGSDTCGDCNCEDECELEDNTSDEITAKYIRRTILED